MAITVSILQKKTFLRSVDPLQPSNFHFDLSLKLSQVEVHHFSGEMQFKLKRSQGRFAPPHTSKSSHALNEGSWDNDALKEFT
jgi:hypothetical protein